MQSLTPDYFDRDYYDGGKGYHTYDDDQRFQAIADQIILRFSPDSVLDFGCAKGYLVRALRNRGVDAHGYDISEWAVNNTDQDILPFISSKMLTKAQLAISIDTWEHIPEEEIDKYKKKLQNACDSFYFVVGTLNTPDWQHDASHINMHELSWWQEWWPEAIWEESK